MLRLGIDPSGARGRARPLACGGHGIFRSRRNSNELLVRRAALPERAVATQLPQEVQSFRRPPADGCPFPPSLRRSVRFSGRAGARAIPRRPADSQIGESGLADFLGIPGVASVNDRLESGGGQSTEIKRKKIAVRRH